MFKLSKILTGLTILALSASLMSGISSHAAGVVITVTPSTAAVSTATTPALALTTTVVVPIGGTIQVTRPTAGYTGIATLAVSAGAIGATTNTISGTESVSTATVTTAIPIGALTISVSGLTTSATAANNSFKVYTSAGDYGSNFQYVGSANVVSIRARVPLVLAFAIRDTTDATNTNICDMGDLTIAAVGSCEYRLKVTTNARLGYTINSTTSGNFTNGTDSFNNAAVGAGGTGGTAITAGTENYGVLITKGSITGVAGTTTLASTFNGGANDVAYNHAVSSTILTANKPNSPAATDLTNTTLVRHEVAISTDTPAGIYSQTVTYTIAPSF